MSNIRGTYLYLGHLQELTLDFSWFKWIRNVNMHLKLNVSFVWRHLWFDILLMQWHSHIYSVQRATVNLDKCFEITYLSGNLLHCNFLQVGIFQQILDCLLQLFFCWWFFNYLDQRLIIIRAFTFIWKKNYSLSTQCTKVYGFSFEMMPNDFVSSPPSPDKK